MPQPVKLSDTLVDAARAAAEQADGSIARQIEHWARVGRIAAPIPPCPDVSCASRSLSVSGMRRSIPTPQRAPRTPCGERLDLLSRREGFCTETVFSDSSGQKLHFPREAQRAGYRVLLIAVRIDSVELSIARVMQRVEVGGHEVPDEKLAARFPRTQHNLTTAIRFAGLALEFDDSDVDRPLRDVATWVAGRTIRRLSRCGTDSASRIR